MTEDDLREAASDPHCPFTYEELWDMYFDPRGPSISEMLAQIEAQLDQCEIDPKGPSTGPPASD